MNINGNNNQVNQNTLVKISKFLSLILRHKPETIGLTLDEQGWTDVNTLIVLAQQNGKKINRSILEQVVKENDKRRFAFNEDKSKIRANQGHSVAIDLNLQSQKPPEYLYHGTARRFLDSIYSQGLLKQSRHHVHLSADHLTAMKVGQRHGKAVVLTILAGKMDDAGLNFFLSENNVWLTDAVLPEYILN